MNNVTNNEYETALRDVVNLKILNKVRKKYYRLIPQEELERCLLIALWNALRRFNPTKGRKFTSYLYISLEWECCKWITNDKKDAQDNNAQHLDSFVSYEKLEYDQFNDILSVLPKRLSKVIEQKILYNMTFKEIAKKNKYSHETARKRFLEGLGTLNDAGIMYSK